MSDYKYYKATKPLQYSTPTDQYKEEFQQFINDSFYDSSDIMDIELEDHLTGEFLSIKARVMKYIVRKSASNSFIFDDGKEIALPDFSVKVYLGDRVKFSGYTWIIININNINNNINTFVVRRCNSILKWYDNNKLQEIVCSASNKIANLDIGTFVQLSQDELNIIVKYDAISNTIKRSPTPTRFLLNHQAWSVESIDNITNVNNNIGYTTILLKSNTINDDLDDIENSIADRWKYEDKHNYILNTNVQNINIDVGKTFQIVADVLDNGKEIINPIILYSINNTDIAKVDSDGSVIGLSEGDATVSISYLGLDNQMYTKTVNCIISNEELQRNYTLEVTPYDDSYWDDDTHESITIRDGDSCEFNAILKDNSNIVDNARFDFNIDYNGNATNILGFKINSDTKCTV
ncbi:MAG: Ig-like domain-containing protein, partial [Bacillota bacterium]|nr:Ig-like domain-containing protein [Bacillota bacterium]